MSEREALLRLEVEMLRRLYAEAERNAREILQVNDELLAQLRKVIGND